MLFDMNILHLSDTHGAHRSLGSLPEADVIVHSGDIAMNGSSSEVLDFMRWFSALPYAHKIFVAGNHDACLYGAVIDGLDSNCHYLCNSSVEIDGVTFYGVPMFMEDCRQSCGIVLFHVADEMPYDQFRTAMDRRFKWDLGKGADIGALW